MTSPNVDQTRQKWLRLGDAARLVGVNPATLRLWADQGRIHVGRTAGGHRRFDGAELLRVMEGPRHGIEKQALAGRVIDMVHRKTRNGKTKGAVFQIVDEDARRRFRALGRSLVDIVTQFHSRVRDREALIEEAYFIGVDCGTATSRLGLTIGDGLEAFAFHRRLLIDVIRRLMPVDASRDQAFDIFADLIMVTDEVERGLLRGYQGGIPGHMGEEGRPPPM
jgi:hypothetical protein